MTKLRKTTFAVIFFLLFSYLTKADYFAGLPINQTLIEQANKAMEHFKSKLERSFDCGDGEDDDEFKENVPNGIHQPTIVPNQEEKNDDEQGEIKTTNDEYNHFLNREWYRQHSILHHRHSRRAVIKNQFSNFKKNCDKKGFTYFQPLLKRTNNQIIPFFERRDLYNAAKNVDKLLGQIKAYLVQYNNVIIGSNNSISGNNNVVIGSRNSLSGSNYWVFDSDVSTNSTEDGVLIVSSFLIEMLDIPDILTRPKEVIRCVHQKDSDDRFKNWWNQASPHLKMCL